MGHAQISTDRQQNAEAIQRLMTAIDTFNQSSLELVESYHHLRDRLNQLDAELAAKNRELQKRLDENKRMRTYLHDVLESLWTGVIVADAGGNIKTVNRAARSLLGIHKDEDALGKPLGEIIRPHLCDERHINRINLIHGQGCREMEVPWRDNDGRLLRMKLMSSPMTDRSNNPLGSILLLQDVTSLRRFEEQLNRNKRLAAMGEMAAEIAHKVRNPLGSIELFASLLKQQLDAAPDNARLAEHILVSVKHMDHIISNLLAFTDPQKPVPERIEIHALLEDVVRFAMLPLKYSNVEVTRVFDGRSVEILGDRELLKQAFFNIILNAMQAMEGGGELALKTKVLERGLVDPGRIPIEVRVEPPVYGWVEIEFKDNGVGIPEEDLQDIFNPFYSRNRGGSQKREERAGLGLAIVHKIVESHKGFTHVESAPDQGTVLTVTLPLLRVSG